MSPRSFKSSFALSIVDGVVSSQRQSTLRQVVVMALECVVMSVRRLVAWVRRINVVSMCSAAQLVQPLWDATGRSIGNWLFVIVDGLWPILLIRTAATAADWGVLAKALAKRGSHCRRTSPLCTALHRVRYRVLGELTASEGRVKDGPGGLSS